jgi:hypothetical protein
MCLLFNVVKNLYLFLIMLSTCKNAAPSVIFAYGTTAPPAGGDISYHGAINRGTKTVNLISVAQNKDQVVPDSETLDFTISNVRNRFNCSKLP